MRYLSLVLVLAFTIVQVTAQNETEPEVEHEFPAAAAAALFGLSLLAIAIVLHFVLPRWLHEDRKPSVPDKGDIIALFSYGSTWQMTTHFNQVIYRAVHRAYIGWSVFMAVVVAVVYAVNFTSTASVLQYTTEVAAVFAMISATGLSVHVNSIRRNFQAQRLTSAAKNALLVTNLPDAATLPPQNVLAHLLRVRGDHVQAHIYGQDKGSVCAFVTANSPLCVRDAQAVLGSMMPGCRACRAPLPKDVRWRAVGVARPSPAKLRAVEVLIILSGCVAGGGVFVWVVLAEVMVAPAVCLVVVRLIMELVIEATVKWSKHIDRSMVASSQFRLLLIYGAISEVAFPYVLGIAIPIFLPTGGAVGRPSPVATIFKTLLEFIVVECLWMSALRIGRFGLLLRWLWSLCRGKHMHVKTVSERKFEFIQGYHYMVMMFLVNWILTLGSGYSSYSGMLPFAALLFHWLLDKYDMRLQSQCHDHCDQLVLLKRMSSMIWGAFITLCIVITLSGIAVLVFAIFNGAHPSYNGIATVCAPWVVLIIGRVIVWNQKRRLRSKKTAAESLMTGLLQPDSLQGDAYAPVKSMLPMASMTAMVADDRSDML